MTDFVSVDCVAKCFQVRQSIARGIVERMPHFLIGTKPYTTRVELDRFIEACTIPARASVRSTLTPNKQQPGPMPAALEDPASLAKFLQSTWPRQAGVYFVQTASSEGPIKIGMAQNIARRLGTLQTAHPWKLTLLLWIEGDRGVERDLHWKFKQDRINGEWFMPSDALLNYISQRK